MIEFISQHWLWFVFPYFVQTPQMQFESPSLAHFLQAGGMWISIVVSFLILIYSAHACMVKYRDLILESSRLRRSYESATTRDSSVAYTESLLDIIEVKRLARHFLHSVNTHLWMAINFVVGEPPSGTHTFKPSVVVGACFVLGSLVPLVSLTIAVAYLLTILFAIILGGSLGTIYSVWKIAIEYVSAWRNAYRDHHALIGTTTNALPAAGFVTNKIALLCCVVGSDLFIARFLIHTPTGQPSHSTHNLFELRPSNHPLESMRAVAVERLINSKLQHALTLPDETPYGGVVFTSPDEFALLASMPVHFELHDKRDRLIRENPLTISARTHLKWGLTGEYHGQALEQAIDALIEALDTKGYAIRTWVDSAA